MAKELTHFIGGKHVKGASGRFTDAYQPMTGEVISKVPLASKAEVRAAIENAKAAQPAWAATNPQRRARVLMKFLDLVARDMEPLAELLAREHGKTIPDAKGDIQRGVEVVEFACGVPHLMKGEYTDGAGPGIDIYSMRQPLGVVAGITPFNFPAMIPMWKFAPAIACGNAFILKPSERTPSVSVRLAELATQAGLPDGILQVVHGDKVIVDAILDNASFDCFEHMLSKEFRLREWHRVDAVEAGATQSFGRNRRRLNETLEGHVAERVRTDGRADLIHVKAACDQLCTRGEIDAVEAWPLDRRT